VEVITLGCRLNMAESQAMRALAADEDDLVIVNSCAVTNEAVRQTRQAIRRAKRARPDARVVVTGCAAQVEPDAFAAMPEVNQVVGNAEKLSARAFRTKTPSASPTSWRCDRLRRTSLRVSQNAPAPLWRCRMAATTAAPFASSPMAAGTAGLCLRGSSSSG
jgi:tRNA A37 methylthiotransferase MiaB